jgi:hypothetical protein
MSQCTSVRRVASGMAATAFLGALVMVSAGPAAATPTTQSFATAGSSTFVVPACVTTATIAVAQARS